MPLVIDAITGKNITADKAIDQDIQFIKELIDGPQDDSAVSDSQPTSEDGKWHYQGRPEQKSFLFEVRVHR